jgi:hypothetical protein
MIQNNGLGGQDDSLTKTTSTSPPPELVGSHKDLETSSDEKNEFHTVGTSEGETGISHRRLTIIVIGLCLTIFLTALDQVHPFFILLFIVLI